MWLRVDCHREVTLTKFLLIAAIFCAVSLSVRAQDIPKLDTVYVTGNCTGCQNSGVGGTVFLPSMVGYVPRAGFKDEDEKLLYESEAEIRGWRRGKPKSTYDKALRDARCNADAGESSSRSTNSDLSRIISANRIIKAMQIGGEIRQAGARISLIFGDGGTETYGFASSGALWQPVQGSLYVPQNPSSACPIGK